MAPDGSAAQHSGQNMRDAPSFSPNIIKISKNPGWTVPAMTP